MVREVHLEAEFPQCTPQEFFEAIFADEGSIKVYHKLNSSEEGAEVTQWEDNTRTVKFFKELQLPGAISYLFSSNKLPVKETQKLQRQADGSFVIKSTPELQIDVGYSFIGVTELTVCAKGEGSEVTVCITCEASGPWGLINVIEGQMADEAKKGFESFLVFCETRIAETKMEKSLSEEPLLEEDFDDLHFFDVQYETLSEGSFAERPILESRDNNNMLTTDALILARVKRLENDLKISAAGMEAITRKLQLLEMTLEQSRRNTRWALIGCSALSVAMLTTVIVLKRQNA